MATTELDALLEARGWSFDPELHRSVGGAWWAVTDTQRLTVYRTLDGSAWTYRVEQISPLTGNAVSRRTTTERWATAADAAEHLEIEELGR